MLLKPPALNLGTVYDAEMPLAYAEAGEVFSMGGSAVSDEGLNRAEGAFLYEIGGAVLRGKPGGIAEGEVPPGCRLPVVMRELSKIGVKCGLTTALHGDKEQTTIRAWRQ
jgi:hypothetical protein